MEFEWNESKRLSNLSKHGIDFADISAVFAGSIVTVEDARFDYGEDAMTDEDIDLSDCPEITPEQFAKAIVRSGLPVEKNKAQVTLRIDHDVLEWFKAQGQGYQTQINSLLRAYMKAHH
jgi:uncharacterized protein (DUF4415 family)